LVTTTYYAQRRLPDGSLLVSFSHPILLVARTRPTTTTTTNNRVVSDLALDNNKEERVRVNFNVTMMDLACRYAVIDVVSVLGTQQNVTKHVTKWDVSAEGVRQRYQGRNKEQHDIELFDPSITESIEDLVENGEDAISLDAQTFEYAKHQQEFLFVDFFASCTSWWWLLSAGLLLLLLTYKRLPIPGCSHCRDLAPTVRRRNVVVLLRYVRVVYWLGLTHPATLVFLLPFLYMIVGSLGRSHDGCRGSQGGSPQS
jgi:hypothetical protein